MFSRNTWCLSSLFLLSAVLVTGCIDDTDRYRPIEPGTSPLAYLGPSADFSWNTMDKASVTIEVDDKFNNEYDYIVRVYSYDPISVDEPNALFSGTARGNAPLTYMLDFPSKMTNIYVEVTDPQGYSSVYGYEAPAAGTSVTLPCRVGQPAYGTTRAAQTRAAVAAEDVDFTIPSPAALPTFDTTVPADASEVPDVSVWGKDAVYIVPQGKTIKLNNYNNYQPATSGQLRILVAGTLDIQTLTLYNGAQLYILPGGKLRGDKVVLAQDAVLHVADGAYSDVMQVTTQGSNALLYAGGDVRITDKISFNNAGSNIYVAPTGRLYGGATVEYMQGDIYVDADTQSSGACAFSAIKAENSTVRLIVAPNATMDVTSSVKCYGQLYNGGLFSAATIEGNNGSAPTIYNACTLVVSDEIAKIGDMYLKHGTVSGKVQHNNDELTFTSLKKYAPSYTHNIYLLDGSFIFVEDMQFGTGAAYGLNNEGDAETSFVRCSQTMESQNGFTFYGNVVAEVVNKPKKIRTSNGAVSSKSGNVLLDLTTCTGAVKTREVDPTPPTPAGDYAASVQAEYTVNFEDQWPVLGDYDLNDIVLHVKKIDTVQNGNEVKKATFTFELLAVGATYTLGMGLEFVDVDNAQIKGVVNELEGQAGCEESDIYTAFHLDEKGLDVGESTDKAIIPLFYNAHKVLLDQSDLPWSQRETINTGEENVTARTFTVTVTFADGANVSPEALLSSSLNFFIYRVVDTYEGKRVEIHLKNFPPTRNAVYTPFLTDALKALPEGSYFVTDDGFPWGLIVSDVSDTSTPWTWPDEAVLISTVYADFDLWVKSNGKSNKDWMDK